MSLRIGIDLTALQPLATGVDNCLTGLVRHLPEVDGDDEYVLFVNRPDGGRFSGLGPRFRVEALCPRSRTIRLGFQQALLPWLAGRLGLDVLHSPSFFMPLRRGRLRHVPTVYDMTSFTRPREHTPLRRSRPYVWGLRESIRRADRILVPSPFVEAELLRQVPGVPESRLRIVAPGIADEFRAGAEPLPGPWPRPYLLFVGTLEPRKNLGVLFDAFERLVRAGRPERLLLAGRDGWGCEPWIRRLTAPPLAGRVQRLGYVPQAALPALYAGASAFVYPSREEGFGLPPLEAMASGTPTVASRGSALESNLAGAAELVAPLSPEALAAAIGRVLEDNGLRARMVEAGKRRAARFRWLDAARETVRCYRELGPQWRRAGLRPGPAT